MVLISVGSTSPRKRDLKAKRKPICKKDTRLWCMLFFCVIIYGVIWIPASYRIELKESEYQSLGKVEADLGDLKSSHTTVLVANTTSPGKVEADPGDLRSSHKTVLVANTTSQGKVEVNADDLGSSHKTVFVANTTSPGKVEADPDDLGLSRKTVLVANTTSPGKVEADPGDLGSSHKTVLVKNTTSPGKVEVDLGDLRSSHKTVLVTNTTSPGKVEANRGDLQSSHKTVLVANTSSLSFLPDTPIANNVKQGPSRSQQHDTNNSTHRAEISSRTFVDYRLEYDKPYKVTYGPYTQCAIGVKANKWGRKKIERVGLSNPFSKILNVTAYLRTNLKIITLGDSVGIQFHEILEEALQPPTTTAGVGLGVDNNETYRTIYQYAWGGAELSSVAAPVNGGGALAALRMTGLFLEEGRGKPPPNSAPNQTDASGGWLPEHVQQILDHNYTIPDTRSTGGIETTKNTTIESFDVMFYRIPHGWLAASSITRERLETSLLFAKDLFGVHTIIVQSLFLNNNIKTMEDLEVMRATNQMIRDLVKDSWGNPDFPDLLLMDFGYWTDQLTEMNARSAGIDTKLNSNYTLERLGCAKFPPSIAMTCVEKDVKPGSCACTRNVISIDGMHWCMETVGGRVIGALSCLLQCSLSTNESNIAQVLSSEKKGLILGNCQQRCNDAFMSLREASTLTNNITIVV